MSGSTQRLRRRQGSLCLELEPAALFSRKYRADFQRQRFLPSFRKFTVGLVVLLVFTALYLYAFPAPTLLYAAAILLHAGAGLVAIVCLIRYCLRYLKQATWMARLGWITLALGGVIGGALVYLGT